MSIHNNYKGVEGVLHYTKDQFSKLKEQDYVPVIENDPNAEQKLTQLANKIETFKPIADVVSRVGQAYYKTRDAENGIDHTLNLLNGQKIGTIMPQNPPLYRLSPVSEQEVGNHAPHRVYSK